jgi:hypothetical protein
MASFTDGLTLEDYISSSYENALDQELRASGYPEHILKLDDAEISFVASLRGVDASAVDPNLLSQSESSQVLAYRANQNCAYTAIRSEYESAKKFLLECKQQAYVLPWFRHVILFRGPTPEEWLDHRIDMETIDEEAKSVAARETVTRRMNRKRTFAQKMTLCPQVLPTENLSLLDSIYSYVVMVAIDGDRADALKIKGP